MIYPDPEIRPTTFEYDLFKWSDTGKPCWTKTRARETHQNGGTRWLEQRSYFAGSGGVIMVKVQAPPGERDEYGELVFVDDELQYADTSPDVRWVGNGRSVKDNKGNVIKAYEPYYSSTPDYEDEAELVEQGVTALNHYDPLGRLIRTDFPNGTFSRVEFTPWQQITHDQNDTATDSDWYDAPIGYVGGDDSLLAERRAAELTEAHANTPTVVHLDVLGRPFLSIACGFRTNLGRHSDGTWAEFPTHLGRVSDAPGQSFRRTWARIPAHLGRHVRPVEAGTLAWWQSPTPTRPSTDRDRGEAADDIVGGCSVTPCDGSEKSSDSNTNCPATTARSRRPPACRRARSASTCVALAIPASTGRPRAS